MARTLNNFDSIQIFFWLFLCLYVNACVKQNENILDNSLFDSGRHRWPQDKTQSLAHAQDYRGNRGKIRLELLCSLMCLPQAN